MVRYGVHYRQIAYTVLSTASSQQPAINALCQIKDRKQQSTRLAVAQGRASLRVRRLKFRRPKALGRRAKIDNGAHSPRTLVFKQPIAPPTKAITAKPTGRRRRRRQDEHHPAAYQNPSEALVASLGTIREVYISSMLHRNKLDLSHNDPMKISHEGRCRPTSGGDSPWRNPRPGLKRLLAEYLRCSQGGNNRILTTRPEPSEQAPLGKQLLHVLNDRSTATLEEHGHDFRDLDYWAWIITAKSSDLAALRLWTITNSPNVTQPRSVPDFVYLFLLRRMDWNVRSINVMIQYAWSRLQDPNLQLRANRRPFAIVRKNAWMRDGREKLPPQTRSPPGIHEAMIIFVRLLRHVRKVYPEACVSIAALLARYLSQESREKRRKPLETSKIARLTFLFNSALSLLSRRVSMRPFLSTVYQQRAQFRLLRRMHEFDPPLAVDREGYRAITRVQLAHKKTIRERDWASLKAKSWPPWKEDKSGLDSEKGPEYGVSRAGESMRRTMEAGYADQQWEDSAGILAGWDTDESPTIQTRTLVAAPIMSRRALRGRRSVKTPFPTDVWAARIRATRTIDEAWACFLAYKDESVPQSQDIYFAMLEKLVFEEHRARMVNGSELGSNAETSDGDAETVLPGDSPKVYEKPSPLEAIYVRTSPPDPNEFFRLTLRAGIRPSGRFLAFILKHADSLQSGLWYLRESALPPRVVFALFSTDGFEEPRLLTDIKYVTDHTFAAFIHFLCRFSPRQSHRYLPPLNFPTRYIRPGQLPLSTQRINPLLQAFRLLLVRRPFYRPPWNSVLSAFARSGVSVDPTSKADGGAQDLLAWNYIRTLVGEMVGTGIDLDFTGFQIVCVGFEKGIFAAARIVASRNHDGTENVLSLNASELLEHGLPFVKSLFKRLISNHVHSRTGSSDTGSPEGGESMTAELMSRLLEVPHPAQLHAFIRVLGLLEDFAAIETLIEWMSLFAPELQVVADEAMNGRRCLRRCLVAARVFIEQSWAANPGQSKQRHDDEKIKGAVDEETDSVPTNGALQRIYKIVQKQEEWGGWPTEQEVEEYCKRKRR